jgi:hypothetical protein
MGKRGLERDFLAYLVVFSRIKGEGTGTTALGWDLCLFYF